MTRFKAVTISILFGVVGIILAFALDEGIFVENELALFASLSFYNFIVCLFIGRYCPKSVWFGSLLINIIVWSVLIANLRGQGGFVDLWYGWTGMVIGAYAGSFVGLVLSRKKRKQIDTDRKEE
jgi:hypothetical protein